MCTRGVNERKYDINGINLYDPENLIQGYGVVMLTDKQYNHFVETIRTFPYIRTNRWLSKVTEINGVNAVFTFATSVYVKERLIDIDTEKVYLKLRFRVGEEEKEKVFDSSILNTFSTKTLLDYGVRFYDKNAFDVTSYLIMNEETAPVGYVYSRLGWNVTEDTAVFKSGTVHDTSGSCKALYQGALQLLPRGSLKDWIEMIKTEVIPNTALAFVMLLGFASPILSYLNTKYDIGAMMFNLSNRTSKGKTTAAMLAASVFSNPVLNKGTAITYNATENALIQFLSGCMGHTVVLDEVAISNCSDFNKLMYTICNGRSKMRLNGDATQKAVHEFNSVIISTAEFDLLYDDSPAGLKARVFEVKDQLTVSADNSDNIKRCIIENHAVAGGVFIDILLKYIDNLPSEYNAEKNNLISKVKVKKELTERIISKLAIILLTARYFNRTFENVQIDLDSLTDYILKLEKSIGDNISTEQRFMEILKAECLTNSNKYIHQNGNMSVSMPHACVGKVIDHNSYSDIVVIQQEVMRICEKNNISNPKGLLKNLKAQGVLQGESDRLYKRLVIQKALGQQKCYCFKISTDNREDYREIKTNSEEQCSTDVDITDFGVENTN